MNKTRGRIYWIIFVIFILVFILLVSHQQAAAEMAADRRYSFSLTLEPYDPSRQSALQSQQESMYLSAWIVGFIIPAALMLISYFIHDVSIIMINLIISSTTKNHLIQE